MYIKEEPERAKREGADEYFRKCLLAAARKRAGTSSSQSRSPEIGK